MQVKIKKRESSIELIRKSSFDIYNAYFLTIAIVGSISSFLVSINTRTVQIHFEQLIDFHQTIFIGIFFVVGNLVSAYASDIYKKYLLNRWCLDKSFLFLGGIATIAFLLMSFQSVYAVFVGFLVLCSFKSIYRPVISANIMTALRNRAYLSTAMSMTAMLSASLGLIFSYLYSWLFTSFEAINLTLSFLIFGVFIISSFAIRHYKEDITELFEARSMSSKKHFIKRTYSNWTYIQEYPDTRYINQLFLEEKNRNYPSPKLLAHYNNKIEWEYISGELLSNLCREEQLHIVSIISNICKKLNKNDSQSIIIHGDLHPDNILVIDKSIYVIDWDLAEVGEPLFDGLTFITSPKLDMTNNERIEFISDTFNITKSDAEKEIKEFLSSKSIHFSSLIKNGLSNSYLLEIADSYKQLAEKFQMEVTYEP